MILYKRAEEEKSKEKLEWFLRSVEHQSVPLPLDVVVFRLFSDVDAVKLQLPGQLLLSLEDNKRDLMEEMTRGRVINVKRKEKKRQNSRTLRQLYPMMQRKEMMVWTMARKAIAGSM